jgi:glycosyltransferase involved in cell wall biosynthesis
MRICLVSVEIFAWGKHGGFGRATRTIGRELARRGHEVCAVVPRRHGQQPVESLDGIRVLGFPPRFPFAARRLFRECGADVYHSCEPSLGTYLAWRAMPGRRHVATVRDPRDLRDWATELALPSLSRLQVAANWAYESSPLVKRAVRGMDGVYVALRSAASKVRRIYRLEDDPLFLPTPVEIPRAVRKAEVPTVCFLGRTDRRKRPELFLGLAARFPEVRFVVAGESRDPARDAALRQRFARFPNLETAGFVDACRDPVRHSEILGRSWVLVNTSAREGLPNAFLEAAAHRCAILSGVDPDGFSSRFGFHVRDGDFERGLSFLLEGDRWRERGERGYELVRAEFGIERAMDLHEQAYARALS